MKKAYLLILSGVFLLVSCGSRKNNRSNFSAELVDNVDQFQMDTIVMKPGEQISTPEVDHILRHYPELYHASQRAQKAYEGWVAQGKASGLETSVEAMDFSSILNESLLDTEESSDSVIWLDTNPVDSTYLQLLSAASKNRKTDIGRVRHAWHSYLERLHQILPALPEDSKLNYTRCVKKRIDDYNKVLKQYKLK